MSGESIPLAKHLDLAKMQFPAYLSEKLDGVPVRFIYTVTADASGNKCIACRAVTRQWEDAKSCWKYLDKFHEVNYDLFEVGSEYTFVWEVTHRTFVEFKDVSGVVRRQTHQDDLIFNLFDFAVEQAGVGLQMCRTFNERIRNAMTWTYPAGFRMIMQMPVTDKEHMQDLLDNTPLEQSQEGWVIRSFFAEWKPGSRHWDYQKIVKEPTIDLHIVGMEEGVGKFAGGVGKLIALYKGEKIGVGPGKQTTAERNELWAEWTQWQAAIKSGYKTTPWKRMACIKYKPDDGYKALRQPTFQHWRDDKGEPDA